MTKEWWFIGSPVFTRSQYILHSALRFLPQCTLYAGVCLWRKSIMNATEIVKPGGLFGALPVGVLLRASVLIPPKWFCAT
jgi:hypothetical protein